MRSNGLSKRLLLKLKNDMRNDFILQGSEMTTYNVRMEVDAIIDAKSEKGARRLVWECMAKKMMPQEEPHITFAWSIEEAFDVDARMAELRKNKP